MADEDTESLAVTSSAAPWNAGALPSFVPVKMTATPEATVHSPNPTPQQEDNGQQQQHQQQLYQLVDGQQPLLPKRKLQPDHCKEAVDIALHAHKQLLQQQHRLQLVDNTGADFRHVSSHQRRKASEYAGLAPSSRSSKHALAMADSQMYRKRVERKASEERSAAAERSSAAEADSFAEELSPDALGRHDRTPRKQKNKKSKKNKNKKKGKKSKRGSTLSTSPPRSPSVQHQQHQQRDQHTQPSSPSLPTPEISISRGDSVTDDHNSTEPQISPDSNVSKTTAAPQTARRRDSSVVHLHTPEVLPPTTPQKSRRDGDEASDLQTPAHQEQHDDDERRQQQQQEQPDILSDLLTPESAPQSTHSPADVAHLQLPPSAALIPLALRMSTKKKDNNKNNAYNTHATDRISDKGVLSPPGPHLAEFRRVNSRVSLTAPDDREQPSATSISKSQQRKNKAKQQQNNNKRRSGADVSQAARRGQDGNGSDGSAGHSQSRPHQPVRRISSSKTLSIVWAKRPQQPTSASHRALLRQQKQWRTKGGGGGVVKQLIKRQSAPQVPKKVNQRKQRVSLREEDEVASAKSEDYEDIDEESGEEEYDEALPDMPREKLDFSEVKPLVAQRNSGAGQAAQRNSYNPQKPSSQRNSSSVNWRKRSSKTQQQRQQQQQHTVEHLPLLTGTHGAVGSTLSTGFRAEHRHSSVPPKSVHERFSSPEGESGSTQVASDGTHTFPDVLPQLVHGENNSDPSHQLHSQEEKLPQNTLEAVLARHRLAAEIASHPSGTAIPGAAGGASSMIPQPPQPRPPGQSPLSPLLHSSSQHASGSTNYYYDYLASNASHGPVSSFTSQGHRSLHPSPPVRQGATRSGRRLGPAGTSTYAALSRSNTTTAIEKQKFAPLVAASSTVSNNASHHHSRSNFLSTPQHSFFQTHNNTTDLFGHSHAAVAAQQPPPSQRSSDAERPHATVVVAAVVGDDSRGGADDKRRSEDVRRSAVDTAARHEYPTVAPPLPLPRTRLPPVARKESDEGENSVHTPPSGSDGLTKSSAAPTPPSPPSHQKPQRHLRKPNTVAPPHSQSNSDQPPPHRQQRASTPPRKPRPPVPPPPRRNNKVSKQKAARDRQLIGYAFAPYMPGMPAVSGGRVRQTPAIEVYRNQNVHQKRRMQNMKDRKRNNNMKKKNHQQQHDAIAKPKPIDYTALATQSDPLDYLLGRHGFWGETTTR